MLTIPNGKDLNVPPKSLPELKKALRYLKDDCDKPESCLDNCPYWLECNSVFYPRLHVPHAVLADALAHIENLESSLLNAQERIKQLEAQVPKWISVEERLPEKSSESNGAWHSNTVLAINAGYILLGFFNVYKYNGCWEFICVDENMDYDTYVTVTHWMPLPEPPKEE